MVCIRVCFFGGKNASFTLKINWKANSYLVRIHNSYRIIIIVIWMLVDLKCNKFHLLSPVLKLITCLSPVMLNTSEITKENAGKVSGAVLIMALSVVSKSSLQVLIRVRHQRAFKEEGRRFLLLVWPWAGMTSLFGSDACKDLVAVFFFYLLLTVT